MTAEARYLKQVRSLKQLYNFTSSVLSSQLRAEKAAKEPQIFDLQVFPAGAFAGNLTPAQPSRSCDQNSPREVDR